MISERRGDISSSDSCQEARPGHLVAAHSGRLAWPDANGRPLRGNRHRFNHLQPGNSISGKFQRCRCSFRCHGPATIYTLVKSTGLSRCRSAGPAPPTHVLIHAPSFHVNNSTRHLSYSHVLWPLPFSLAVLDATVGEWDIGMNTGSNVSPGAAPPETRCFVCF